MLSPDGQCKTFDKNANGYVPGEGIGVLLLQRLTEATADGSSIHAVVKGSAVNHGGAARSLTAPSVEAQRDVIMEAFANAGVSPETISVLEAHGTGTPLGDPIEVEALRQAFRAFTADKRFCHLGSVKTNIGHLEAAAGMAGVIKVILMMKRRTVVPTLNVRTLNPLIDLENSPFVLAERAIPWAGRAGVWRAGVSSFGFGGVNSHVILQSAPVQPAVPEESPVPLAAGRPLPFVLSAKSENSLRRLMADWLEFMAGDDFAAQELAAACHTLVHGRHHFPFRVGAVVREKKELAGSLRLALASQSSAGKSGPGWLVVGGAGDVRAEDVQRYYETDERFRCEWDRLGLVVTRVLPGQSWSEDWTTPIEAGRAPRRLWEYAVLHALTEVALRFLPPSRVMTGEQTGVWVALCRSGLIELEGLLRWLGSTETSPPTGLQRPGVAFFEPVSGLLIPPLVITTEYLAALFDRPAVDARQLAATVDHARLLLDGQFTFKKLFARWNEAISAAGGQPLELTERGRGLESDAVRAAQRDLLLALVLADSLRRLRLKWDLPQDRPPLNTRQAEILSLLADGVLEAEDVVAILCRSEPALSGVADRANLRLGERALTQLCPLLSSYNRSVAEIGEPSAWCLHLGRASLPSRIVEQSDARVIGRFSSRVAGPSANHLRLEGVLAENMASWLVQLWKEGVEVDLGRYWGNLPAKRVSLPVYPFDGEKFWIREKLSQSTTTEERPDSRRRMLRAESDPVLRDHRIGGRRLAPGAWWLEWALTVGREISGGDLGWLGDIHFVRPAWLEQDRAMELHLPADLGQFEIRSGDTLFCRGKLGTAAGGEAAATDLGAFRAGGLESSESVYQRFRERGYDYGPSLRVIQNVWRDTNSVLFEFFDDATLGGEILKTGSARLDGVLQAGIAAAWGFFPSETALLLPHRIEFIRLWGEPSRMRRVLARRSECRPAPGGVSVNLETFDAAGCLVLEVRGVHYNRAAEEWQSAQPPIKSADRPGKAAPDVSASPSGAIVPESSPQASATREEHHDENALAGRLKLALAALLASILNVDAAEVDGDTDLREYGLESISLTEYAESIVEKFHVEMDPVLLFEHPTLDSLAKLLLVRFPTEVRSLLGTATVGVAQAETAPVPVSNTPPSSEPPEFSSQPGVGGAVAIIGMGGRFPEAPDLEVFWKKLLAGEDCVREIPRDRWRWEDYFGDPRVEANKTPSKWGGFLDGIDGFDAAFFKISPSEAVLMDPQQRLLLELAWQTVEDAGYNPRDLAGSRTGVFIGVCNSDYQELIQRNHPRVESHTATGAYFSIIPNRISFLLGLHGPSIAVDTACSSSLVALHQAVRGLQNGDCTLALVGGVNICCTPNRFLAFGDAGMLSHDGRCKTFDKSADGYVRGEGAGCLLLKPLETALADGDQVRGVIRSAAVNHGGFANSLTAPNPNAQADLLVSAYRQASVPPESIGYIEVHGTGTSLGDPIEVAGLKKAFAELTSIHGGAKISRPYCGLGSVKTNIGHLESAAGIAGIMKVLLAMRHRTIPASLHLKELNPQIDLAGSPFFVVRQTTDWPAPKGAGQESAPRRAGVSSFGFGGMNAHVVLEEAPVRLAGAGLPSNPAGQPELILLSARTKEQLAAYATKLLSWLSDDSASPLSLPDLAHTFQVGREAFPCRLAILAGSLLELTGKLAVFVAGKPAAEVFWSDDRALTKSALGRLDTGDMDHAYACAMLKAGKLDKLAGFWVTGSSVDWERLYASRGRRRVPAPTYPFERKRYWLPAGPGTVSHFVSRGPVLKGNVVFEGTLDGELAFRTELAPEWPLLNQHRVEGRRIFPGVGHLEMVCQARDLQCGMPFEISNVIWRSPVGGDGDRTKLFTIFQKNRGLHWQICDQISSQRLIYSQGGLAVGIGAAAPSARPSEMDLVRSQCPHPVGAESFYARWQACGIDYGPFYRGVRTVWRHKDELIAEIGFEAENFREPNAYFLHPGLMDSILQAAGSLFLEDDGTAQGPPLPFSLESLRVHRPLEKSLFAVVLRQGAECVVRAVTIEGDLLLEMKGLAFRPASSLNRSHSYFVPDWTFEPLRPAARAAESLPAGPVSRHILVCYPPGQESFPERVRERHPGDRTRAVSVESFSQAPGELNPRSLNGGRDNSEVVDVIYFLGGLGVELFDLQKVGTFDLSSQRGVFALFRGLGALHSAARLSETLELRVATRGVCIEGERGSELFWSSGLTGFCQTLLQEFPKWKLVCLETDLDPTIEIHQERIVRLLAGEPALKRGEAVAWIQDLRRVRRLRPVHLPSSGASKFRAQGVYLILGGAGGIGAELSYYLASKYHARLAIVGRSKPLAKHEAQLARIRQNGGEGIYLSCDAACLEELQRAVEQARETYGEVHGVFHSAVTLEDRRLFAQDEASFKAAWTPKAGASLNLALVFAGSSLDFLVFFSSALSILGNPGQCNYVAGCAFQDDLARVLRARVAYPVRTINWGYWGTVGIVSGEAYRKQFSDLGIDSIAPEDGFQALERILSSGFEQVVYYKAERQAFEKMGVDFSRLPGPAPASGWTAPTAGPKQAAGLDATISQLGRESVPPARPHPQKPRNGRVEESVRAVFSQVLQIDSKEFDSDAPYIDFGVDSTAAVKIIHDLNERLGTQLRTTDLFSYISIARLVLHLETLLPEDTRMREEKPLHGENRRNGSVLEKQPPVASKNGSLSDSPAKNGLRTAAPPGLTASLADFDGTTEPSATRSERPREIAIIGMSGRFPGASNLEGFWDNLASGRNSIQEVDLLRWDPKDHFSPQPGQPNKTSSKWGGWLKGIDLFDPLFFNISPREAQHMDPKQRLFLEAAWSALEDAGQVGAPGSRKCGVFVGCSPGDYRTKLKEHGVPPETYNFLGNSESILAARISYFLDLHGPALTVDTACSSSLMAVHLACESLRSGVCDLAIAGGVCVLTTEEFHVLASQAGMLSAAGQCRAFDQGADGFVPAEGVGAVVLKDLAAAIRDGDAIHAVINGHGANQDGRTNGITAPSAASQTRLELEIYERFGLNPEDIQYVEAHGTGTRLGDPIEVNALTDAFRKYTPGKQFCGVGSVKTNIGHCLAAAGIAGLLKVVLSLKHRKLAASLHLQQANEHIHFAESPFYVVTQTREWPAPPSRPRQAVVSSFGFSGTNVHVAVREAGASAPVLESPALPVYPIAFSAKSEEALLEQLKNFGTWMDRQESPPPLPQVSFSSLCGRGRFLVRLAMLASDWNTLRTRIEGVVNQASPPDVWRGNSDGNAIAIQPEKEAAAARFLAGAQEGNPETFHSGLALACELWAQGCDLVLSRALGNYAPPRIRLPTYPFERKSFWIPGVQVAGRDASIGGRAPDSGHTLVHQSFEGKPGERSFETIFDGREFVFAEHKFAGTPILPGVAFIEMAREAGARASGRAVEGIRNLVWIAPLTHAGKDLKVEVTVLPNPRGEVDSFVVKSRQGEREILHAQGRLSYRDAQAKQPGRARVDLDAIRRRCGNRLAGSEVYAWFRRRNLALGPHFQTLQEVVFNESESLAELKLFQPDGSFQLHPGILDGAFQSLLGFWGLGLESLMVPYAMEDLRIFAPTPSHCYAHALALSERDKSAEGHRKYQIEIVSLGGEVILRAQGFHPRALKNIPDKPAWKKEEAAMGGFVVPEWVPASRQEAETQPSLRGNRVIFDLNEGLLEEFRRNLAGDDSAVIVGVRPGDRYRELGNQIYEINPLSRPDYERLLTTLESQGLSPHAILHYWSQDGAKQAFTGGRAVLEWPAVSFIHLCQSLLNFPGKTGRTVRLDYAFSTQDEEQRPGYAAMCGLIRCLNRESGSIRARQIEFRRSSPQADFAQLAAEVAGQTGWPVEKGSLARQSEVMLENGQLFEKAWRAAVPNSVAGPGGGLRRGATYLITGGMGGIGGILAGSLAAEFQSRLVLLGRSPLNPSMGERIARWEGLGSIVKYYNCDLTNESQVAERFRQIEAECGPLHGVFHCAGVTADSYLARKTPGQFDSVLKPKIQGLRHIDRVTAGQPLDFVCLFSSVAAVTGNPGQSDYALANAFLDHFADYRETLRRNHQRSGVTLSINWPLWEHGGMSLPADQAAFNPIKELAPLTNEQGWLFVRAALASGLTGSGACHENQEALLSLLNHVVPGRPGGTMPVVPVPPSSSEAAPEFAGEKRKTLVSLLKRWVCEIMLLDPGAVREKKPLGDYGFDSMSFTKLAAKVNERFHLEVSPALFFEFPTLDAVSQHLLAAHDLAGLLPTAPVSPALPADRQRVEREKSPAPASRREVPGISLFEPIAVIGMGGVFPDSPDLETFWEHLKEGDCLIREIPAERWNWRDCDGDPTREDNKTRIKFGGFMPGVADFDAGFFGISPREADLMDPQQRIFLQTAWHAIEDAGYRPSELAGRNVGVFVGVCTGDYFELIKENGIRIEAHTSTGMAHSIVANRVSYLLDLRGPSEPVDTACSSSLTALNRAVEALRSGRCEMAIAGGVNAILTPTLHISFGKAGMLSEDGKCKTFDDRADGYVRGEGCGAVLLKPLGKAVSDRDPIQAVILSSQENHGGRANSLTAPNPQAQSRLIKQAIQEAGVDAGTISYVEAHGTGTRLGDPIEIRGLISAFDELFQQAGRTPGPAGFCGLGSVKTNVGHLEAAAGIAGLIKVVLAMKNREIPATLHFQRLNSNIRLAGSPFYIAHTRQEWKPLQGPDGLSVPRRAGLSSFGFGGANVHLVLEEAPAARPAHVHQGPYLAVLSAKSKEGLKAVAGKLLSFLQARTGAGELAGTALMSSLAYTLQTGREPLEVRAACLVRNPGELAERLNTFLQNLGGYGWFPGPSLAGESGQPGRIATEGEQDGFVAGLCRNHKWEELARLWVGGTEVDWRECYNAGLPSRMSLPGYPFAAERHWIPLSKAKPADPASAQHPLLDGVDPRASLGFGAAFSKRLDRGEPVCRDHRVQGRLILPAVAYLEMALAAAARSAPHQKFLISQVFWLLPVVVGPEAVDLRMLLKKSDSGPEFLFEVSSGGPTPAVHSTGQVSELEQALPWQPAVDPRTFKERAKSSVTGSGMYDSLLAKGYEYGVFFKGVRNVWLGEGEALAEIQVPQEMDQEAGRFHMPPTILDGSLQILSVFYPEMAVPLLPFSVERVEVAGRCGNRCLAYVRREGEHRFYIEILDEREQVCVRLHDFCYREWSARRANVFYAPRWVRDEPRAAGNLLRDQPSGEHATGVLVVRCSPAGDWASRLQGFLAASQGRCGYLDLSPWVGAPDSTAGIQGFHEAVDGAVRGEPKLKSVYWIWEPATGSDGREVPAAGARDPLAALTWFYRMTKQLMSHPSIGDGCRFHLLTRSSFPVFEEEPGCPVGAALWGMLRAVAPEYPGFEFRCADLDARALIDSPDPASMLIKLQTIEALPLIGEKNQISLRSGFRYVRQLCPVELPKPAVAAPVFRAGGLYVIVGWRGLGLLLGDYLQKRYQARVVFLGRSAWDEARQRLFERHPSGAYRRYIQADICNAEQCGLSIDRIRREEGEIHGVIHAAMDLQDQTFHRMEEGRFLAALAVKSLGTVNLLESLKDDKLDFVLLFSSLQSWVTNPGQCNYVAGSCFQDLAARCFRNRRSYPLKVINWGNWGGGGAVSGEVYEQKLRSLNLEPISPDEGFEAIERILRSSLNQCFVIKASGAFFPRQQIETSPTLQVLPGRPSVFGAPVGSLPDERRRACLDFQRGLGRLEQLGRVFLTQRLWESGCFNGSGPLRSLEEWGARLRCVEPYSKWIPLLWEILARQGLGSQDQQGFQLHAQCVPPTSSPKAEIEGVIESSSSLSPFARLLMECVQALPEILSGQTPVTDVLFPNADMGLVAAIYQKNDFSDAFNQMAAQSILSHVEARLRLGEETVRILEVGSGTGGTTAAVLDALQPHAARLNYYYTDISDSFLQHGKREFGASHPFVEFRRFNAEQDAASQGFQAGQIDVILAANVLHATRNIRGTLRNLQPLLKAGGWLVLNEATRPRDFLSLTFALTPGWWLFDDAAERSPHSPLLSPGQWKTALLDEGFGRARVAGLVPGSTLEADEPGQHVIVAETTGIISLRQNEPPARDSQPTTRAAPVKAHDGTGGMANGHPGPAADPALTRRGQAAGDPEVGRLVREVLQKVLQTTHSDFDERQSFANFGVDSILGVEVIQQINQRLGTRLRTTDIFNFSTIEMLSRRLREVSPSHPQKQNGAPAAAGVLSEREEAPPSLPSKPAGSFRSEGGGLSSDPRRVFEQVRTGELSVEDAFRKLRGGGL